MFWPRFKVAPIEEKHGVKKYYDHERGQRGVLRKMYPTQLSLTQVIRNPQFGFAIARRNRVFAMTASGDINQFKVQIQDSSGETYFAQPITLASILCGYVDIPPPAYGSVTLGATGGFPPTVDDAANTLGWRNPMGEPKTMAPFVFEPSIVLDSNEVLQLSGFPLTEYAGVDYRVDITFHVWEFPSWGYGPA